MGKVDIGIYSKGSLKLSNYRPQRSYGKVMFLQLSVILSGGCGDDGFGSVDGEIGDPPWEHTSPPSTVRMGQCNPPRTIPPTNRPPQQHTMLTHMVNKWMVCILLECNVVILTSC